MSFTSRSASSSWRPTTTDEVIGCAALHVFWEDLAELKCLAVSENAHGQGVGRKLRRGLLGCGARTWRSRRSSRSRTSPTFFERCGYHIIEKAELPHKIWNECVRCPLFPNCTEIALIRSVDIAPIGVRQPGQRSSSSRLVFELTANSRAHPLDAVDRWRILGGGWCVALLTAILMIATEPKLAIVWDEGYTLGREARLRLWFRALTDPPAFASTWVPPPLGARSA